MCPRCGGTLDTSATPTGTAPRAGTPTPSAHTPGSRATPGPSQSRRADAPTVDGGRFPPGTLLIDRYRVVELLGRGAIRPTPVSKRAPLNYRAPHTKRHRAFGVW